MAQLETSFSLLPEELIRIVFSYLPSQDLLTCRQVCSEFKNYLDASSIWKSFIKARDVYEEAVLSKVTPWKAFLYLRKKETDWKKGRFVIVNQDDGIKSFDFNKVCLGKNYIFTGDHQGLLVYNRVHHKTYRQGLLHVRRMHCRGDRLAVACREHRYRPGPVLIILFEGCVKIGEQSASSLAFEIGVSGRLLLARAQRILVFEWKSWNIEETHNVPTEDDLPLVARVAEINDSYFMVILYDVQAGCGFTLWHKYKGPNAEQTEWDIIHNGSNHSPFSTVHFEMKTTSTSMVLLEITQTDDNGEYTFIFKHPPNQPVYRIRRRKELCKLSFTSDMATKNWFLTEHFFLCHGRNCLPFFNAATIEKYDLLTPKDERLKKAIAAHSRSRKEIMIVFRDRLELWKAPFGKNDIAYQMKAPFDIKGAKFENDYFVLWDSHAICSMILMAEFLEGVGPLYDESNKFQMNEE